MSVAGEAKRAVKRFSQATGLPKKDAQRFLERVSQSGRHFGLTEGDTYRVAADVASMVAMLGPEDDFSAVLRIMTSGWETGSLKTLAGTPMRDHTPLLGVQETIVALAKTLWPKEWEVTCARHPEFAEL